MPVASSRTTGGDPVEGVDPGGTRPTRAGTHKDAKITQTVESGERNTRTSSDVAPANASDPRRGKPDA